MTLIHYCVYRHRIEIVSYFLSIGIPVDETSNGWTPLHLATQMNDVEMVNLLIFHNANVLAQDKTGLTPLIIAVTEKNVKIASILLNAAPTIQSLSSYPLNIAIQTNQVEMVKLLLQFGVQTSIEDSSGHTAFDVVSNSQPEILSLLKTVKPFQKGPALSFNDRMKTSTKQLHSFMDLLKSIPREKPQPVLPEQDSDSEIQIPEIEKLPIGDIYGYQSPDEFFGHGLLEFENDFCFRASPDGTDPTEFAIPLDNSDELDESSWTEFFMNEQNYLSPKMIQSTIPE